MGHVDGLGFRAQNWQPALAFRLRTFLLPTKGLLHKLNTSVVAGLTTDRPQTCFITPATPTMNLLELQNTSDTPSTGGLPVKMSSTTKRLKHLNPKPQTHVEKLSLNPKPLAYMVFCQTKGTPI